MNRSADVLGWIGDETVYFRLTSRNGEVFDYSQDGLLSTWEDFSKMREGVGMTNWYAALLV